MESILKYFWGEKMQCGIGVVLGLLTIAVSVYILSLQKPFFKGMAYTFIPLSLFLLAICIGIVIRTPKDIKRVSSFYSNEPSRMKSEELPRMDKVMKTFPVIKKAELGFIIMGLVLFIAFGKNEWMKGIGLGLIIQGVLLYGFDHIAEARGNVYFEFLKSL